MNKLLLYYGIFVVGAISFLSFANADTWNIPEEALKDECAVVETPTTIIYNCLAVVNKTSILPTPTPETEPTINGTNNVIELGEGINFSTNDKEIRDKWDELEEKLAEKQRKGLTSPADDKLLEVLENRYYCWEGNSNSAGIQAIRPVEDLIGNTYNSTDNHNLDANTELREVLLKDQECDADYIMDNEVHSLEHAHKYLSEINPLNKKYLIPMWRAELTEALGIEYPDINQETYDRNEERIIQTVCYSTIWKNVDKIYFGCPEDSLYEPTEHDYDYQGIESQLNPIPDLTDNEVLNAFKYYQTGDDSIQLAKNIKVNAERQATMKSNYGGNN